MYDLYNKLKSIKADIIKFKESDKSKLISVSINIACLFTLLVISTFARNSLQLIGHDGIELLGSGVLDVIIVMFEVLLCFQIGSYVFNRSEKVNTHIPYALIISLIINFLVEMYKILKLIDIKISIANLSATSHTLTAVNVHIVLIILILFLDLVVGIYIYRKFFK